MRRLAGFLRRPFREKVLLLEACLYLAGAWLAVRLLPFRRYARWLGRPQPPDAAVLPGGPVPAPVRSVRRAIRVMARHVPGFTCLMQAVAACLMLRRRGFGTVLYLGVRRGDEAALSFHAWLRHGPCIVTGGDELDPYQVVAMFVHDAAG